ncbi:hypothetical protein BDZ94DRAFT_1167334 [Collybia nuda]|uniref:Uncharacterized protein n=1 Tax=Collybia nuda TaxID=64659 RepID=A0A9P5Y3Q6_9AGAR|nr:hypothetical protein BDZ94DRAFT_1167334 [Collybia nuda]
MWIPFLSSSQSESPNRLQKRKGGGGKGGGGRSSGGSKGGSGRSSGSKGSSSSGRKSAPISFGGSSKGSKPNKISTTYGRGGGSPAPIPAGQIFAGRIAGGGTRDQIFGNKIYGSGYPGVTTRGVGGRGFPFYFWPLAWGGVAGVGAAAYLHTDEYGLPNNSSRPGGVITTATYQSPSGNTTFRIMADNSTVIDLIADLKTNCSSSFASSSSTIPSEYTNTPNPEQVIQYYRASSIALSLDGYNNTAVLAPEGTPDTPLPANIDIKLMDCLNQTIGLAAPLIDCASGRWAAPQIKLLGLAWVLWNLMAVF